MVELALKYGEGWQFLKEIAKKEEISEKYLSQIVIALKGKGLLSSERGMYGGYRLTKHPKEINLKEIIEALEGDFSLVECVDNPLKCKRSSLCVSREVWKGLKEKMQEFLESLTLQDLVERYKEKEEKFLMYNI
jgi:Rrf2 family protein